MLVHEISRASSVVSIDSAWMERKRLLISLMKEKSVYQIQVKSSFEFRQDQKSESYFSVWCIALCDMVHTTKLYGAYGRALCTIEDIMLNTFSTQE